MIPWPTKDDAVLIQGITGKEGSRMSQWMTGNGSCVRAGVTPGKGGQDVDGIPVFDSVREARQAFPEICVSSIVVPPLRVLAAAEEALREGITFLHILTEQVPTHDVLALRVLAQERGATILGPASVGYLAFPSWQLGYLGGQKVFQGKIQEGSTEIISNSGGMANELLLACGRAGVGVRRVVALGGGSVCGISFAEALQDAEERDEVKKIALFIEPGQPLLESLLSKKTVIQKPMVLMLAGQTLDDLPKGVPYGHTGTIVGAEQRTVRETFAALKSQGVRCVDTIDDLLVQLQLPV